MFGIVHICRYEAGQQRKVLPFLKSWSRYPVEFEHLSCFLESVPVPLLWLVKQSSGVCTCVYLSVSSAFPVRLFYWKRTFATERQSFGPGFCVKENNYLLHGITASKPHVSIHSSEHSWNNLFCLYQACCSLRASSITWSWKELWIALSLWGLSSTGNEFCTVWCFVPVSQWISLYETAGVTWGTFRALARYLGI